MEREEERKLHLQMLRNQAEREYPGILKFCALRSRMIWSIFWCYAGIHLAAFFLFVSHDVFSPVYGLVGLFLNLAVTGVILIAGCNCETKKSYVLLLVSGFLIRDFMMAAPRFFSFVWWYQLLLLGELCLASYGAVVTFWLVRNPKHQVFSQEWKALKQKYVLELQRENSEK